MTLITSLMLALTIILTAGVGGLTSTTPSTGCTSPSWWRNQGV